MTSVNDSGKERWADGSKKQRIQRACDICRRRKIRCGGIQDAGDSCSNCINARLKCTFVEASQKRNSSKAYISSLESRLQKLEKVLEKLAPGLDHAEVSTLSDHEASHRKGSSGDSFHSPIKHYHELGAGPVRVTPLTSISRTNGTVDSSDLDPSDDEYLPHASLTEHLRTYIHDPYRPLYLGKSSEYLLIQDTMALKKKHAGDDRPVFTGSDFGKLRPEFWSREEEKWVHQACRRPIPKYEFPPSDLIGPLVDLYLANVNIFVPLFHEPTLKQEVASGLHLRDPSFASVLLLICACGSRWADDPRVLMGGSDSLQSAGWRWYNQVKMYQTPVGPLNLYEVQLYALFALFLQGTASPQACWTLVGVGLRVAQNLGAHRAKMYNSPLTKEDELWKRAFWVLVTLDRAYSSGMGRSCSIQEEDFDLDMPVACDDEYWDHPDPDKRFQQPPGQPSKVDAFICLIKLNQILGLTLRTIYCINKSKVLLGFVGPEWEQRIVAELDSEVNKWFDELPEHLRWNPDQGDTLFFRQSAMLYCNYYTLQIQIHRPFISKSRKLSPLSYPSLAICTRAARSLSHVADTCRLVCKRAPSHHMFMGVFVAALVLLLNIWTSDKSGVPSNVKDDIADVNKCIAALRDLETRWYLCGRTIDLLRHLATAGSVPLELEYKDAPPRGVISSFDPRSMFSLCRPPEPSPPSHRNGSIQPSGDGSRSASCDGVDPATRGSFSQRPQHTADGSTLAFSPLMHYASSGLANGVSREASNHQAHSEVPDLGSSPSNLSAGFQESQESTVDSRPQEAPTNGDMMDMWLEMVDWESYITNAFATHHYPHTTRLHPPSDGPG